MSGLDDAIAALAAGKVIIITGDRLRGGDIDFAIAARHVTMEAINFMASHGRGLICLAMGPDRAVRLGIGLLNPGAERQSGRPFGRSIEARRGVTTGISAADRAETVRVAASPQAAGDDLVSPGHVFPLIAARGGIVDRPAAAEAAIELCRLADAGDMAVICSIMRDDGEMARIDDLDALIRRENMAVADIGDMLERAR
ncbi:3,4-dihydroxy-2-butanone-4-phosphate synthase [Sphingomonas cavernae]|uniref:3,4-dihydroxy-2-butanone 4-phosphate synthase n=1 Tax=Sphingomonas cavernae TaxID=2320861 RepID=A0A418WKP2_9SPHN|nr:3,4-dihydroxy-2-butanone-4-phosphate synthase [Sphingomonas cavernae]RJF90593.1 3,4-dihydroxy-2-butanone 4-phosphate synthase [Sphingomonas cavernae]